MLASRIICRGSTDIARTGQLLIQNNTNGTVGGYKPATRVIIDDVGRVGLFNEDPQANLDVSVGDNSITAALISGSLNRNSVQIMSSGTGISTTILGGALAPWWFDNRFHLIKSLLSEITFCRQ